MKIKNYIQNNALDSCEAIDNLLKVLLDRMTVIDNDIDALIQKYIHLDNVRNYYIHERDEIYPFSIFQKNKIKRSLKRRMINKVTVVKREKTEKTIEKGGLESYHPINVIRNLKKQATITSDEEVDYNLSDW